MGCSPWGREESDTTERLHLHFSLSCIGEGNGNPLQCSCLENPRGGRAWWAAIYGVAESNMTEGLSSSSSSRLYKLLTLDGYYIVSRMCTYEASEFIQKTPHVEKQDNICAFSIISTIFKDSYIRWRRNISRYLQCSSLADNYNLSSSLLSKFLYFWMFYVLAYFIYSPN